MPLTTSPDARTRPEPAWDDLARLAAIACRVPAAGVVFVDGARARARARAGTRPDLLPLDAPRDAAPCAHTVAAGAPLVVPDARVDARFRDLPSVARADGVRFYAGAPIVAPDGTVVGTVAIADVVPRELTADEVAALAALARQAARLVAVGDMAQRMEVERLKSEFVSTVSHELRTPLTSIRGSLGLIEAGVVGDVSPRARELTRIARTNADRLIRLINDILDLEKIEAGRLEMRVAPLDPSDLVTTTLEELHEVADQRAVRLVARLARHDRVLGDRDRVVQVLTNLVSNAVKFAPERGDVVVRTAEGAAPGTLRFLVEDAGPGIAAEQVDRLFRRFSQLDAGDARARGGTGLGLAISRSIVEQLGGRIGVESTPGVRTCFWFELPTVAPPREPVGRDDDEAPHAVLVVEDDRDLADILSILLAHEGFAVAHAATLAEATAAIGRRAPSVVLLDVALPDGDGIEWVAERQARGELRAPVVVLSGHEPGERATPPLVREWLTKPSDERFLFGALRRAVRRAGAPRALVVDADAEARQVRVAQLAAWGVACVQAGDGTTAYALARLDPPDLIVLDPSLPSLDGFALVARLRQGPVRATPLLVHSSRELAATERRQLALGPTMHLVKSLAGEAELARALRTLLDAFDLDAVATR